MKLHPYFSVIIPLFNKGAHIQRAVDSILNQTIDDFELIIVNDGSTDNSEKVLANFIDRRIKLINQTNQGVSAARNKGIENSRSNYIAFLDADDVWKPNFLETIKNLIESFPNAGIYATRYSRVSTIGIVISHWNEQGKKNISNSIGSEINYFKEALSYPPVSSSSVCIPKKVFLTYGMFKVGEKYGEDIDMWGRIALHKSVAISQNICAIYYQDAENRAGHIKKIRNEPFLETAKQSFIRNEVNENIKNDLLIYLRKILVVKSKYHILNGYGQFTRSQLLNYRKFIKIKSFISLYLISILPSFVIKYAIRFKK